MNSLEVLFTPADFAALPRRNLDDTTCVVFDVFRATSSIITALANGAGAVVPVAEIHDALALRRKYPGALLAGERDGVRIGADLTGGVEFDLGNSPREFTADKVSGKVILMTTTNGTRALRACAHAQKTFIGCFLNLKATADRVARERPGHLVLICSGTFEQAAYEDILAAGALCDLLWQDLPAADVSDAALAARRLYQSAVANLPGAAADSRNGRRLREMPDLRDDVPFCLRRDAVAVSASLNPNGEIKAI
jgi:2-phosphosulfolactate phosphatase